MKNRLRNALERQPLNTKLGLVFLTLFLIVLGIGAASVYSQYRTQKEIGQFYNQDLRGLGHLKDLQRQRLQIGRELRQSLIARDDVERELALRNTLHSIEQTSPLVQELRNLWGHEASDVQTLSQMEPALADYVAQVHRAIALVRLRRITDAEAFVAAPGFIAPAP